MMMMMNAHHCDLLEAVTIANQIVLLVWVFQIADLTLILSYTDEVRSPIRSYQFLSLILSIFCVFTVRSVI